MILYVETNFILGAATGRDAYAEEMLRLPAGHLRIALPSICVMEACSWFESERKRRIELGRQWTTQIGELQRDQSSLYAKSLLDHLEQARIDNGNLLNDVRLRLHRILMNLGGVSVGDEIITAPAELIPLRLFAEMSLDSPIKDQPTDNLILSIICDHARRNPEIEKVLLTGNCKDFDTPEVQSILNGVGIHRCFKRTEAFLGWFYSRTGNQPPSP